MSIRKHVFGCIAAIAVTQAGAAVASDGGPVGLVTTISGGVKPEISAYSEIAADTRIELAKGAKMAFIHYPSCRLMTVAGGTLRFSQQDVQLDGGVIESEAPQKCPKQLKMKIAGVAGGVRMRAIPTTFLAASPKCTLVGARNRAFAAARVMAGDQPVANVPLDGPAFAWPASQAPLAADKMYRLELLPKIPGEKPMAIDFAVGQDAPDGATECLLRVE